MERLWDIVLTTSYQGAIVGIVILLVKSILKNKLSAKWHYLIWMILIVKLILPFGPESKISIFNILPNETSTQNFIINTGTQVNTSNTELNYENADKELNKNVNNNFSNQSNSQEILNGNNSYTENTNNNVNNKASNIFKFIPYIWAIVSINILAFSIIVYTILNIRLSKNNIQPSDKLKEIFTIAKGKIKTGHKVKIVINKYISTPALSGVLKPKILLPTNMTNLSDKELEYVFLHELSHYKRKDIFINYILLVLQAIHWFNPVIWYLLKKVREDIEFATDEKVLKILEEKEYKDYAKSILSVLEKVNASLFYPRLVSMANDKKKVEKRIRIIKDMKFTKKKQLMFTIVGIIVVLIIAPIVFTNSKKENNDKNKEIESTNIDLNKLQTYYVDLVSKINTEENLSKEQLKEIITNINMVEQDGYIPTMFDDVVPYNDLRSVEFRDGKQRISATYSYVNNKAKDLTSIHYMNSSKNGYLNGVHALYNLYAPDEIYKTKTKIGSVSVQDQMKLVEYINKDSMTKEAYKMYFEYANKVQSKFKWTKEEIDKFRKEDDVAQEDNVYNNESSREAHIFVSKGNIGVSLIYDTANNTVNGIKLHDGENGIFLYTKSEIGNIIDIVGQGNNVSQTTIVNKSVKEQENLLLKLNKNIQKSTPIKIKEEISKDEIEGFRANNKYVGMKAREEISYSSELKPKELTMEESIEYIKKNTRNDIKEMDSVYEKEVGVTEVTYEAKDKIYIVRYMHPYKTDSTGETLNDYDKTKTVGIWVYENII